MTTDHPHRSDSESFARPPAWTWRVAHRESNRELGLLYEPGNWGDVLKGTWAVLVARAVRAHRAPNPVTYLDPFAGSPCYPLLTGVRERIEWLDPGVFLDAQRPWIEQGKLASTGMLVRGALCAVGPRPAVEVFDAEPSRLDGWRSVDGVTVLAVASGIDALERAREGALADFVLVDPYDFFGEWRDYAPAVLAAARRGAVLVYLYNKSPRGAAHYRNYRALREALAAGCGRGAGVSLLAGRIPSDAVLPRAFHEVLFLGPESFVAPLQPELSRATRRLACKLATTGAFEAESGGGRSPP